MNRVRRILGDCHGSEIAEMAMVLPVMFFVFLGIFWMGRMYNIYATVNQGARDGARVAAQSTCASCGDTGGSDASVDTAVSTSLQADHLNMNSVTAPNPDPSTTVNSCSNLTAICTSTTHNISVCRNVLLTPTGVKPEVCGVLVEFTYKLDFRQITIPFGSGVQGALPQPQIAARAQMAVEQ